MRLRFSYTPDFVAHPLVTLGGRKDRPRPMIAVAVIGPTGTATVDALLDTGADDTVFPEQMAASIGIDLTNAPTGTAGGVASGAVPVRYAEVELRIADNQEQRRWKAWVGFAPGKLRRPLLGFAGCLQYFTATFHGDREEIELTVNGLYPGT